jgi:Fe-Mn family superoxide dismutase
MAFQLQPLPFASHALEPHMSAETLAYHHGRHHKAYVDKVNGWIGAKGLAGLGLVEIIRKAHAEDDQELFNNAAQVWNHNFFWKSLAPGAARPSGQLAARIDRDFGSVEKMLAKLKEEAVGHFASGWAWLVLDGDALRITSLHDAETPVAHEGMKPLLTLDLWEHAYYVDYRHARPDYAETVLDNLVNWSFVAENLDGNGARRADQAQDAEVRQRETT